MMNLLGCTKENFHKLMNFMDYKRHKEKDTYVFLGEKRIKNKRILKDKDRYNPFKKLLSLNIKQ